MSVNIDGCDDLFICDDLNIHNLKFIILSVCNSVPLSTFAMLTAIYNHQHYPFPKLFHHLKQKLCTL